ncbi:MAG: hypothetical protein EOP45_23125 [Sphingobacteriaceae bacterium]|nr:MAG: hypothetical protein EOP45_23125 [Sphingobacteriaceae bacterium]
MDSLKQLYNNIQITWQNSDMSALNTTLDADFTFKNEIIQIWPSIDTRSWSSGPNGNSDGIAMISLNVFVLNNGRLQPQELLELEHMIILPTLLKKQMYSRKKNLMFEIWYSIQVLKCEWSIITPENDVLIHSYLITQT